jgi:alkylation response protein AidB-like acyl-CoA dehydrogenase
MNPSHLDNKGGITAVDGTLRAVVAEISAGAAERDAHPSFPEEAFRRLALSGALEIPVPDPVGEHGRRSSFAEEWRVLRAVAGADGSVGRILDGHFNGVERLSLLAPEPLRSAELEGVAAGELRLGVWGADPIQGEGDPAHLVEGAGEPCSLVSRRFVPVLRGLTGRSFWYAGTRRDRRSSPTWTSLEA